MLNLSVVRKSLGLNNVETTREVHRARKLKKRRKLNRIKRSQWKRIHLKRSHSTG
jgi:hypothetical protein